MGELMSIKLGKHLLRHIAPVCKAGVAGIGVEHDDHLPAVDLAAQTLDTLYKRRLVTVVRSVTGNEVLKQALQGIWVEHFRWYQHGVYVSADSLRKIQDERGGTLPALMIRHKLL